MLPGPRGDAHVGWRVIKTTFIAGLVLAASGCRFGSAAFLAKHPNVQPFSYDIAVGPEQFHIEGYFARSQLKGPLPGLLVLNGGLADARRCIETTTDEVGMGMQVACVSIPGYGRSSGPGRFVGPQAVAAARRALDMMVARPDVDPSRIAVWGLDDGAVAAGLLMDSDPRPRALILQSGAYDTLHLWNASPLANKFAIMRQVWPSKRVLEERSVIGHLPPRLDCSVLILHGERDRRTPVAQAMRLASALRKRGAHVQEFYFPHAPHELGRRVDPELRAFLRDNLIDLTSAAS